MNEQANSSNPNRGDCGLNFDQLDSLVRVYIPLIRGEYDKFVLRAIISNVVMAADRMRVQSQKP